ncbi:uncharacterized protein BDR25DRAFT_301111 [Lindgomyces ingoldianus]|uniref:Uncharacterized protein n=1 Tax=Lindgomyces ingoldianus TaxID=673940 RepID=A0ACB6R870_9PLEO|nr:uncharacterized protein BDR25DRAFT_301111 [Lindgomyces ingoldianus]KAF2475449.1 hypothetical protein BDR25DRAFT_301111 [Lindgomyces ingoldianus]
MRHTSGKWMLVACWDRPKSSNGSPVWAWNSTLFFRLKELHSGCRLQNETPKASRNLRTSQR